MAGQPTLFQRRVPGETNQPRGGDAPTATRGELNTTAGEMAPCSHRAWTSLRACPHSPSSGATTTTESIPGTKPIYTLDGTHTHAPASPIWCYNHRTLFSRGQQRF